jgi:hypothetical protein
VSCLTDRSGPTGLPAAESVSLAVAIRAQNLEIRQSVVMSVAIDVVQSQRDRPTAPVDKPAVFTPAFLQARIE